MTKHIRTVNEDRVVFNAKTFSSQPQLPFSPISLVNRYIRSSKNIGENAFSKWMCVYRVFSRPYLGFSCFQYIESILITLLQAEYSHTRARVTIIHFNYYSLPIKIHKKKATRKSKNANMKLIRSILSSDGCGHKIFNQM